MSSSALLGSLMVGTPLATAATSTFWRTLRELVGDRAAGLDEHLGRCLGCPDEHKLAVS